MRHFLEIAYQGTAYVGYQRQPNGVSVQGVIEEGLATVLRLPEVPIIGAGRTDAGVHATQSFVHFEAEQPLRPDFVRSLNGWLPPDIVARARYTPAKPDLHARYHAISRAYEYRFLFEKNPFMAPTALYLRHSLDVQAMRQAADRFMRHTDFASFCKAGGNQLGTECRLYESRLEVRGGLLIFHVRANRFLRGMVRAMAGTLLEVGKHRMTLEEVENLLNQKDRKLAPMNAPANGLSLTEVRYPPGSLILAESGSSFPKLLENFTAPA